MSQTVITTAFERWKAAQAVSGEAVTLDEFVFANVPDLDTDAPIDRNEVLPDAVQIVHRQAVSRTGVVNENAVVYSVVLGAETGDFAFNWIGLVNRNSGTLAMIVHAPLQQKIKTTAGQQGNVLTRSFLMEFDGAQTETAINTPAESWQIDFTARMAGMDERQRLENIDIYGAGAFFGNGWLVGKTGTQYFVTSGSGYVAGLRAELAANQNITVTTKPVMVWLDVSWHGTLTSAWAVEQKITVAASLSDYEIDGIPHYVFALASIDADGNITDLRPQGTLSEQQASSDYLRRDKNLADVNNAEIARENLKLGSMAIQNSGSVSITGGHVSVTTNADNKHPGMHLEWSENNSSGTGGIVVKRDNGPAGFTVKCVNDNNQIWIFTLDENGNIYENGVRLYSERNKPLPLDIGAISGDTCFYAGFASGDVSRPYMRHSSTNSVVPLAVSNYASLNASGWHQDTSSGLITQWGYATSLSSGVETHNFNIAFPNACVSIVATLGVAVNNGNTVYVDRLNNQSFNAKTSGSRMGFSWVARGY